MALDKGGETVQFCQQEKCLRNSHYPKGSEMKSLSFMAQSFDQRQEKHLIRCQWPHEAENLSRDGSYCGNSFTIPGSSAARPGKPGCMGSSPADWNHTAETPERRPEGQARVTGYPSMRLSGHKRDAAPRAPAGK